MNLQLDELKERLSKIPRLDLNWEQQEELKLLSSGFYNISKTIYGKASALLMRIDAHYWRALKHLENTKRKAYFLKKIRGKKYYTGYELDIDDYTRHWLSANGGNYDPALIECLESNWGYKAEKNKYLPEGYSIYRFSEKEDHAN